MKVWELSAAEASMSLILKNRDEDKHLFSDHFAGEPMKEWWVPVKLLTYKKGRYKDFPYFRNGSPVFTKKTFDTLYTLICDYVEFLPILHDELELKLINVINVVKAVDYSRSKIRSMSDGTFTGFYSICFLEEAVKGHPIFKIPEYPRSRVFVSDEFRKRVLDAKLKGFDFEEIWDSEITEEMDNVREQKYADMLAEIERNKGIEYDWNEAVQKVKAGQAMASGKWRLQTDKTGNMLIGQFAENCELYWSDPIYIPPILLILKWHEIEKSDM